MHWHKNDSPFYGTPIPSLYTDIFARAGARDVANYFQALSVYMPTPLLELKGFARGARIGQLLYKDESQRLGLQSFKALGGAYAVGMLARNHVQSSKGAALPIESLFDESSYDHLRHMTVSCATDGNHGRSVAWGAKVLGCSSAIFLHEHVSKAREEAIAALGARIFRVPGVYDDSCVEALRVSKEKGWHLVADFTTSPFEQATSWVMQGYCLMLEEIVQALSARRDAITHVFVQGGCGGLAAATAGYFKEHLSRKPVVVVVEPNRANCLLQSAMRHSAARIAADQPTCMSMLECYEPSHMAWPILERTVEAFMDISDEFAVDAAERLASPPEGDRAIHTTPSGAAGLAGLLAGSEDVEFRELIELNSDSRVLVFGSEGVSAQ